MSRTNWNVYTYSSADTWVADGTVYRANQTLTKEKQSTQETIVLANGNKAFFSPETASRDTPILFAWLSLDTDDSLITKIEGYIDNVTRVKIVDHLSNNFIGYFRSRRLTHKVGKSDEYDMEATFERV